VPDPHVVVVVLNWCDEEMSRACLRSLEAVDYDPLTILLVDNGSPDGSGERLREAFPHLDYLQTGSNLGYTGGNNRGIEWALEREADYVLILNNDALVEPGAIKRLVDTAAEADQPVGGVVPKILFHDEPDRIWFGGGSFSALKGLGLHWREGEPDRPGLEEEAREVTFMTGACILLSAPPLRRVGGFDEDFFAYVEDADLSLRLRKGGYSLVYEPRARVLHDAPPPGTPPTPFQIRQRDRNRRRVMRKHFRLMERLPFLARFYLTRAALLARYVASGDGPRTRALLEGAGFSAGKTSPVKGERPAPEGRRKEAEGAD
jgi:hypothetical protein